MFNYEDDLSYEQLGQLEALHYTKTNSYRRNSGDKTT